MSNVKPIRPEGASDLIAQLQRIADNSDNPTHSGGGGGTTLESRIEKLENFAHQTGERLVRIETRLDHIDKKITEEMATKDFVRATVTDAKNSIIVWVVSVILLAQVLPNLLKQLGP